jgi:hypothetical protein
MIYTFLATTAMADKTVERMEVVKKNQLFSILDLSSGFSYALSKNSDNAYFLHFVQKDNTTKTLKFSSDQAQSLDIEFSRIFLNHKYIYEKSNQKDCKKLYKMSMRVESNIICYSEKKKVEETKIFIAKIENNF